MSARFSGRSFDTTLFGEFVHVKAQPPRLTMSPKRRIPAV